jgi:hypothetical protein
MTFLSRAASLVAGLGLALWIAACSNSHLEPPQMQGAAAMVDDGGQPRLWVLTKQEEVRQVGIGGGSRQIPGWRSDTFFHFDVQAFDPVAARPLWKKRLLTFGDPDAQGAAPSRVIGSAEGARLLGQEGQAVWLLIGDRPFAVSAADGRVIADSGALQRANPELQGLLPSEARHYSFDRGLVMMAADARMFVVRGPELKALAYTSPPPPSEPQGRLKANGTREIVPMRPPLGEVPTRQTQLRGRWLGLYSEKEAADAAVDEWGLKLLYPYTVVDEGAVARRRFWHAKIVPVRRFDDRFERLDGLTPVAGSQVFLKGRFMNDARTGKTRVPGSGEGVFVWHSTRIDDAGRLALTRLDGDLKPVWHTELPLSESSSINVISTWPLPGHVAVMGLLQSKDAGVTSRVAQLVSIDLETGEMKWTKLAP